MAPIYDWSLMNIEMLASIFEFLKDSDVDRRRISAVCTSWRSAISLLPSVAVHTPLALPEFIRGSCRYSDVVITQSTFYIISSLHCRYRIWLFQVEEHEPGKFRLGIPACNGQWPQSSDKLRFDLDLLGNYRIQEVAKSYAFALDNLKCRLVNYFPDHHYLGPGLKFPHPQKVVMIQNMTSALILINSNLVHLLYEDELTPLNTYIYCWKDIVSFRDEFYAIDKEGILVKISPTDRKVIQVTTKTDADSITLLSNEHPYLVSSERKLYLLVKKIDESGVGFRIYVLNRDCNAWEGVNCLGNKVFFLVGHGNFCFTASDIGWSRGNFIYFFKHMNYPEDEDSFCVYSLDDSKMSSLKDVPQQYNPIFWPPPAWVTFNN